jgi:hypothetical protein
MVQTASYAHLASYLLSTGVFSGVKQQDHEIA